MPDQLQIMDQRLKRIERMLAQVLHKGPQEFKKRISEREAITKYGISRHRFKDLRLGYNRKGKQVDPVLFHWGHRNGRHIDYDTEELEQVLKQTIL